MEIQKEENKYEMTTERYNLFFLGLCPDCKEGLLEEDWSAAQMENGYEHSMCVYKCSECGELFAEYLSGDPDIRNCVEYHEW